MRIVALSLLLLLTLTLAGCQSKAAKVKKLQDQYNAEYPAYAKACLDEDRPPEPSRILTGEKLTHEADSGSRSQEERTRRTVQARGRPSCTAPERDSRCTAVKPYRCKASRNQRRRRDETNEETNPYRARRWVCGGIATARECAIRFRHRLRSYAGGSCRYADRTRRTIHRQRSPGRLSRANKSSPTPSKSPRQRCKPTTSQSSNTNSPTR